MEISQSLANNLFYYEKQLQEYTFEIAQYSIKFSVWLLGIAIRPSERYTIACRSSLMPEAIGLTLDWNARYVPGPTLTTQLGAPGWIPGAVSPLHPHATDYVGL